MTDAVRVERRGDVALMTLCRPKALNALSSATLQQIQSHLASIAADPGLRALVVTGDGRAFAAGADIAEMQAMSPIQAEAYSRLGHDAFAALEGLPVPTLAAVNGFALGGGCELALSCDWIYASTKAVFGQPEVALGLIPGFGGTMRLTRRVGVAWAKELILGGANIDAAEAHRIGLANRICDPDALLDAALETAEQIAARGPLAVRAAKRVLQQGQDASFEVASALEQNTFGWVFASRDRDEGIAAFLEKRDPKFSGD